MAYFIILVVCLLWGLTLSEGAELVADGSERLVLRQRSVVCYSALHVHHHLFLLKHTL